MAARLNRKHSESVLSRIRTSQLVNRLQDNALGLLMTAGTAATDDSPAVPPKPYQLTDGQIRCALFLIERTVAKAEAPRQLNVTGTLTLEELITGIVKSDDRQDSPSQSTH